MSAKTLPPRPPAPTHRLDDIVQTGNTRWRIDHIGADGTVILEATNVSPGIRWTTTLDRLPDA